MAFACGDDSDCIQLSLDGGGKLIADLKISPDPGNAAECRSNGLYVPGTLAGTSLPPDPSDGDVSYYLADDLLGVVWGFRYRSASASIYKWEFVGGGWLYNDVDDIDALAGGVPGAYVNLAAPGPQITCPLEGDYLVGIAAMIDGAAAGTKTAASIKIGAIPAGDIGNIANYDTRFESLSRTRRYVGGVDIAAGTILLMQYTKTDAALAQFAHRSIWAQPIRVLG